MIQPIIPVRPPGAGTNGGNAPAMEPPGKDTGQDDAAQRLRARIDDPGVSGSNFRAALIEWTPTADESGEIRLPHKLGRKPRGMFLARSSLALRWSVPPAQFEKWTDADVYVWVEPFHPWESGIATIASGTPSITTTLARGRDKNGTVISTNGLTHATATDHPPVKQKSLTVVGEFTTAVVWNLVSEANAGFNITIYYDLLTGLAPSDLFAWQVT